MLRHAAALVCLALVWSTALSARAWTEASVRSVSARLEVARDASAHVEIEARVRVHGGWLEGFEIAGLDPDLALDSDHPPWVIAEPADGGESAHLTPRVRVRNDGRIQLSFRRAEAPRRGNIRVGLSYTTALAHRGTELTENGHIRISWTLPAWQQGLDGVRIDVLAPPGARAVDALGSEDDGIERSRSVESGRSSLSWRRVHLPRTTPWTVSLEVPESEMSAALRRPASLAPASRAAGTAGAAPADRSWMFAALLGVLFACLAVAKTSGLARASAHRGARARALVPLPLAIRAPAIAIACGAAAWSWAASPAIALGALSLAIALALHRDAALVSSPEPASWQAASAAALRSARLASARGLLGPSAWLDATTPAGISTLGGAIAAISWAGHAASLTIAGAPWPLLGLLVVPLFVTGTRAQLPPSPAERLGRLLREARAIRARHTDPPFALRLVTDAGASRDARLRVVPASAAPGLVHIELALGSRRAPGGRAPVLVLLVHTALGSRADLAIAALGLHAWRDERSHRVVVRALELETTRTAPSDAIGRVIGALAPAAPAERAARALEAA